MSCTHKRIHKVLNNSGFTLIELVLVLVIMSIIVALAVPNFNKILADYQLDITAREMASDIRYLQQTAVKKQSTSLAILWDTSAETYYLMNEGVTIKSVVLPKGIDIHTAARSPNETTNDKMHFTANGRPVFGIGGTVWLIDKHTQKNKYVIIDTLGRVRVSETNS